MDKTTIIYAPKKRNFPDPTLNPVGLENDLIVHRVPAGEQSIHRDSGLRIFSTLNHRRFVPREYICPRYFQFYGLSHLIEGAGWYWSTEQTLMPVEKGQAMLSTPGFVQDYAGTGTEYVQDALCFCGPVADHLYRSGVIRDGVIDIGPTRRLLPIIEQAADPSFPAQIKANLMLQCLLVELYFERLAARPRQSHASIDNLLGLLRSNPERWWTAPQMAELCNLSVSQFRRLFLKTTGYLPKSYIDRLKVQHACELLCGSGLCVAEVALRLGYSDPFHFSRRFKAVTGLAPLEYRRRFSR
ncbi:AraC family transcriptional regulator [bacterium]|nr:AraC family transcriptional regulator [bacterium]